MRTTDKIRRFRLSEVFLEPYKTAEVPWGPLGYVTFKRTYARRLSETDPTATRTEEWWQTCRRVIEGMFDIQKQHITSYGLDWNDHKAQKTAKDAYDRMFNLKWVPPGRGIFMMGTKFVTEQTGAGLFNCLQGDIKVLTRYGYRPIKELAGANHVLMTNTGKWVDAPVRNFGKQRLSKISLKHQNGYEKTLYATADHRWFAREKYDDPISEFTTNELPIGSTLQMVFGQGIKTTHSSPQGIQAGLVYGDGTITNGSARIVLCGDKNKPLAKYFPLNTHLEYEDITKEGSIVITGMPAYYKAPPPMSESRPYLYGWLKGYFAADGSVTQNGVCAIDSANRESLEVFKSVAAICGIGTLPIRVAVRKSNLTDKQHTMYRMTLIREKLSEDFFLVDTHRERFVTHFHNPKRTRSWKVMSVEQTEIVEDVYCATVDGYGNFVIEDHILTGNCSFRTTADLQTQAGYLFAWMMDALMLGVGVGFDTLGAGTVTIKEPQYTADQHIIEDSREGWVRSVQILLDGFLLGRQVPKFNYGAIRPEGALIRGFGGTSSGSGPLEELHANLIELYTERLGELITSVDIVDTENLIGRCVVAGNVRRSAALAQGSPDDRPFLEMKNDQEKLYHHRWGSNNSLVATVGMDYTWYAEQSQKNGEPGYIWLDRARRHGRFKDPERHDDFNIAGFNPCVEIGLESAELCNLVETFPAKHDSLEDYMKTLKYAYLYGKTVTLTNTHWPETNAMMLKNRRIGLSQSGIIQAFNRHGRRTVLDWSDKAFEYAKKLDLKYSSWLCVPRSKRITAIKPSGTTSLLNGSTPGIHFPEDEYYIRRIRFANDSELLPQLQAAGYKTEDDKYSPNTTCVEFPVHEPYFEKGKKDVSMWEQLENAAQYQYYWADNAVSVTVTFQESEAPHIKSALEMYETRLKAVSFLKYAETGYEQAPYEPITQKQYEKMSANITPISRFETKEAGAGSKFCTNDSCTI